MDPVMLITIVLIANLSMYHAGNVESPSIPLHVLPGPLSRHHVLPFTTLKGGRYLHTRIAYYANSSATFQSQLLVSGDVNPNPGPTNYGNYSSNSGSQLNGEIKRIVYDRSFLLRCNPIWKTGKKGSITEQTWKNITALGICPSRPFYQKRTKRGGRRKQRKIQILTTPCVNKRMPMPGQTGPNMNNLRHIMVSPDRNLEVWNYSEIEVVRRVRDQHPSGHRKMSNHANLVSVNITKSHRGQNSQHRRMNLPSVLLCNARSLNNKLDEMEIILRERKIDVAAVTETWFRSDMPTHLVAMTDYNLFTKSRLLRQGGGVALYVRNAFNPVEMKVEVPTQLEVLWVKMRPDRLPREISHVVVAVVYHPPDSLLTDMLIDHLQDTMNQIMGQHPDVGIAIMGDFNQLDLSTLLANTNFKQVVDSPTRENRILDKIVTNFSNLYHRPLICCPLGASDHKIDR